MAGCAARIRAQPALLSGSFIPRRLRCRGSVDLEFVSAFRCSSRCPMDVGARLRTLVVVANRARRSGITRISGASVRLVSTARLRISRASTMRWRPSIKSTELCAGKSFCLCPAQIISVKAWSLARKGSSSVMKMSSRLIRRPDRFGGGFDRLRAEILAFSFQGSLDQCCYAARRLVTCTRSRLPPALWSGRRGSSHETP